MKKPNIILIICAVAVAAVLIALGIFLFSGKDQLASPENTDTVSLSGTWVIVANYTNDSPVFVDGQFITFTDNSVSMYKDATDDAYATSSYTVNEANQLQLPDISRTYQVDQKTENCVRLYDSSTTYMLLIRNSTDSREVSLLDTDLLAGKWNVTLKGDILNNGEALEFEGTSLKYYKDASAEPFTTADFVLQDNNLAIAALGLNMKCFKITNEMIIFVEDSGIVWQLEK